MARELDGLDEGLRKKLEKLEETKESKAVRVVRK